MTTLREAAQLALEALESADVDPHSSDAVYRAIDALKAALAEPEFPIGTASTDVGVPVYVVKKEPVQEPVAWQWLDTAHFRKKIPADATPSHWRPLYTAPPRRNPLTEEEIEDFYFNNFSIGELKAFARAIERAHGIGGQDE